MAKKPLPKVGIKAILTEFMDQQIEQFAMNYAPATEENLYQYTHEFIYNFLKRKPKETVKESENKAPLYDISVANDNRPQDTPRRTQSSKKDDSNANVTVLRSPDSEKRVDALKPTSQAKPRPSTYLFPRSLPRRQPEEDEYEDNQPIFMPNRNNDLSRDSIFARLGRTSNVATAYIANQRAIRENFASSSAAQIPAQILQQILKSANYVNSPSLINLSETLDSLLSVAKEISGKIEEQYNLLLSDSRSSGRQNKENILEERSATPQTQEPSSRKLLLFGGGSGGGDDGDGRDGNDYYERERVRRDVREEKTKSGKTRYRDAKTGRFIKKSDAINVRKPGLLKKAGAAVGAIGVAGAGMRFAGLFGKTAKASVDKGAARAITPNIIKKAAGPIVSKALGRTVVKSIPIIGAVAGIGWAAKRLLEGDVVGAGLDAASGLAGPLTAIPALIASVSRDIYSSLYGVQPEQDPSSNIRMKEVTAGVKSAVEETLKTSLQPKQSVSATKPEMPKVPSMDKQAQKEAAPNIPSTAPSIPAPPSGNETPQPSDSQGAPPATPEGGSPAQTPAAGVQQSAPSPVPEAPAPMATETKPVETAPQATMEPPIATKGSEISEMSFENDVLATAPIVVMPEAQPPQMLPSRTPTSRDSTIGMGNVPDPSYFDIADIVEQIYFGAGS